MNTIMKTAREYIKKIKINDANIDYIRHHPERKINGSLLLDIEHAMNKYAEQQAVGFAKWLDENYIEEGYNEDINEPLYMDLLDSYHEFHILFTIKQLYQKFKEEQQ